MSHPDAGVSGGSPVRRVLRAATRLSLQRPVFVLALCVGLAVAASVYSALFLRFKTDRADLINPDADYQRRWVRYTSEFGDSLEDLVVVVEGDDRADICRALDAIGGMAEREPQVFANVLYRIDPGRLAAKGLQFLPPEQLQSLLGQVRGLTRSGLASETSGLEGILGRLVGGMTQCLELPSPESEAAAYTISNEAAGLAARLASAVQVPQQQLPSSVPALPVGGLAADPRPRYLLNERGTMGFLEAQAATGEQDFSGTSSAVSRMREIIAEARVAHPRVEIGLTGIPVLESDEMRDSQRSMTWASVVSFVGVGALMVWGFRRVRYPVMASVVLVIGMAWSFGFATAVVGHLNILSVSFAAMLVGLGIDYAIVYLSRYLEYRQNGMELRPAIEATTETMGPGALTAAATSAVTFLSACLTDFTGVAELGLIGGCGILLCTIPVFLALPAMLVLWDRSQGPLRLVLPLDGSWLTRTLSRRPGAAVVAWTAVVGALTLGATWLWYDGNLLHMQADGLESVRWQARIFEESDNSLLFAVSLADSPREAMELKRRLEALPSVRRVEEIASSLPQFDAAQTVPLIREIRGEFAWRTVPAEVPVANPAEVGRRLEELNRLLAGQSVPAAVYARDQIDRFLTEFDRIPFDGQMRLLQGFNSQLAAPAMMLAGLKSVSSIDPAGVGDLPPSLASRFVSGRGTWMLQVYPRDQIWDGEPLERFIKDVRSVDPDATGTPLQTYEASKAIRDSYRDAGLYSLIAVTLLLYLDFRNLRDTLLALLPPGLGVLLTFGVLGGIGVPLNPANLILLPLILGLGVDGGVHIVHDALRQTGPYRMSVSTLNALFMTSTTSMVGFGSMMIAEHRGLFSLGLVLTIGVCAYLLISLSLLPALLTWSGRRRHARAESGEKLSAEPVPLSAA